MVSSIYNKLKNDIDKVSNEAANNTRSNVFWNEYIKNNDRHRHYNVSFGGIWDDELFNPPETVYLTKISAWTFESSNIIDLRNKRLVIKPTSSSYMFQYMYKLQYLPVIDMTKSTDTSNLFNMAYAVSIDKLILSSNVLYNANSFNCAYLRYVTIEGQIGNNITLKLPKATKESMYSFFNALSPKVTGKTITLVRYYINSIFETYYNARDGMQSDEWNEIVNEHSNWTFSFI